jgi:hypothetical protein
MRDTIAALILLGASPAVAGETARLSDGVALSVRCLDDAACRFHGSDLRVELTLRNTGDAPVELPIAYFRRRGPSVLLTDVQSGRTLQLRTNLAGARQRQNPQTLAPAESVAYTWRIFATEINGVASRPVDLIAEFSVNLAAGAPGKTADVVRHEIHVHGDDGGAVPASDR